ncbi:hypothetical protein V6615_08085 [Oscillospiraceae bacterium PP1C4]
MFRNLRLAACTLAACFLLSSCTGFNLSSDLMDLMRPPRLTAEQKAIDDALKASVITNPIMKYPKSGDYRSAFVFHDIDADGVEEAIVFYAVESNDYARVTLLDQVNGEWRSLSELPGADQDVEFIAFANITDSQSEDIVIGWGSPGNLEMTLGVYSFEDGKLVKKLKDNVDTAYNAYLINDLDNNGLDDIFLLSNNSDTRAKASWIKQISFDGYGVDTVSELPLSDSISEFAGIIAGKLSPESSRRGLFVDELLTENTLVTEVFTIENNTLTAVIEQDMQKPSQKEADNPQDAELIAQPPSLYEQTRRSDTTTVCSDVNTDGVIEIPTGKLMPGYDDKDIYEAERIYLTEYNQLSNGALVRVLAAAINRSGGYRVEFPPEWIDQVTVVNQIESGEWRFITYKSDLDKPLEDLSGELARIRVVSQKDYQDKFLDHYIAMKTRGTFTYYGYVPDNVTSPLAITAKELKDTLFSLL